MEHSIAGKREEREEREEREKREKHTHLPPPLSQVLTNAIYLYPAWEAWKRGWWGVAVVYAGTGIVSGVYHWAVNERWETQEAWRRVDYLWAITYLCVSVCIWWVYICIEWCPLVWESVGWCMVSLAAFWLDHQTDTHGPWHLLWHLLTGVGVGWMVAGLNSLETT